MPTIRAALDAAGIKIAEPGTNHAVDGRRFRQPDRSAGKGRRMNFRRTRAMARKEMLHILRDPRSLAAAHRARR